MPGPLISRRDFVKVIGLSALMLGIDWERAIKTLAESVGKGEIKIVWFESQSCTGDTTSLLEATHPDIAEVLLGSSRIVAPGSVSLEYSEAVMPEWGEKALNILREAERGELDPYVLVLEGSFVLDEKRGGVKGSDYFCYIGEDGEGKPVTCIEWASRLIRRAAAVVTVGTCASYGGIPGNKVLLPPSQSVSSTIEHYKSQALSESPTGSIGFFDDPVRETKGLVSRLPEARPFKLFIEGQCTLGEECRPALAVPGCPANGDAILRVLAGLVLWYKGEAPLPQLDGYWRPIHIYGPTVHDQCPRAGSYAAGDFRENPGDPDYKCLFALGCKGPASHCPWNKFGWVNGVGGPTRTGAICIGCTNPGFSDALEPLYKPLPAPEPIKPRYLSAGLAGGVVAGAAAAYGLSMLREKSLKRREKEIAEKLCEEGLVETEERGDENERAED